MAKGRKTGGRNFEIGNRANPNGRVRVPEEVRTARKMSQDILVTVFNKLIYMTETELRAFLSDPRTTKFERCVARILDKADQQGDHYRLDFILNRLIGKVTEQVQHSGHALVVIEKIEGGETLLTTKPLLIDEPDDSNDPEDKK